MEIGLGLVKEREARRDRGGNRARAGEREGGKKRDRGGNRARASERER